MFSEERTVIETIFTVTDKVGSEVDFIFNPSQIQFDEEASGRDIILKNRRRGFSTLMVAKHLTRCLYRKNRNAVIISHDADATGRLLDKAHFMLDHSKAGKPLTDRENRNEIRFPKTGSQIYIGTAGTRNFGRGDTITDLHCSEPSSWSNPKKLMKGLLQAASHGDIVIEGTGDFSGSWFNRLCIRAAEPDSRWKLHFYPFNTDRDCLLPFSSPLEEEVFKLSLRDDLDEPELLSRGLSLEQLYWRRGKILDEFDGDKNDFATEYPLTIADAFQTRGFRYFQKINYLNDQRWERVSHDLSILRGHPYKDEHYYIGCDVSSGVGRDFSVAEVSSVERNEQVGELRTNRKEPHIFGVDLVDLGERFNFAYINVERNDKGMMVTKELFDRYPHHLIHRGLNVKRTSVDRSSQRLSTYGTQTQEHNRLFMLSTLKKDLAKDFLIHSKTLFEELVAFSENEDGKIEAPSGCHDDCVLALALGVSIKSRASATLLSSPPSEPIHFSPFSLEGIEEELVNKYSSSHLLDQDGLELYE